MVTTGKKGRRRPPPDPLTPDEIAAELAKWDRWMWHLARRARRADRRADLEDVYAVVRMSFVRAARWFDRSRKLTLACYASRGAIRDAYRFVLDEAARGVNVPRRMGRARVGVTGLGAAGKWGPDENAAPEPIDPYRPPTTYPNDFWDRATRCLPESWREAVLLVYRDGLSASEAGRRRGTSGWAVCCALRKALPRIAQFVDRDSLVEAD